MFDPSSPLLVKTPPVPDATPSMTTQNKLSTEKQNIRGISIAYGSHQGWSQFHFNSECKLKFQFSLMLLQEKMWNRNFSVLPEFKWT